MKSLRSDVLRNLELKSDERQITVLGRHGRANHYTGGQLLAEAEQCLRQWDACLGAGPHVLVAALPPGETFLFSLIASLIGEGTLVPVAPPRPSDPPGRLRHIAQTCRATAVLCMAARRTAVEEQLRDGDGLPVCAVLAVDDPVPMPLGGAGRIADRTIPIIQHTSGSTRLPKAVPITAAQIRANCAMIQTLWGMNRQTVMVNWLPHYHDMGLMGGILYPLLSGAYSVQMSPFEMIRSPLSWLQAIATYRATFSGGPSFSFQECLTRIAEEDCAGLDLSSWQRAFCGGEPVPAGLLSRFRQRFARSGLAPDSVFACYGMAEYTLFSAGEPESRSPDTDVSDIPQGWTAVEPCLLSEHTRRNIRITHPKTGAAIPDGETGEIWLRGASASTSYLGAPEETDETFENEADGTRWMRTGDLGGVSGNRLYVTGRRKDVVIVNGRKVAASEIEWLAARADSGLNPMAAAAFMPEPAASGHASLYIELRPGTPRLKDPRQIIARIRRSVAGSYSVVLDDIRILPRGALPRTSSGKIRRQTVAATFKEFGACLSEPEDLR
ncbi:AMP-binding protein [Breoghania sp. L-A4]|uniref:AMP-binding protein n=1 Tax=Breoghania sp. L-A4 TaxID=2304600 RepID=UPI0013C320E6|nr:AMP-binding protein [Breoghania sp. L-A4]